MCDNVGMEMRRNSRGVASMSVSPPQGLQAIYAECSRVYPDQRNPLQVAAVVKYWYLLLVYSQWNCTDKQAQFFKRLYVNKIHKSVMIMKINCNVISYE